MINHVNLMDEEGQVYCCLRNKVVRLDEIQRMTYCTGCKMYGGDAHGRGVECVWSDARHAVGPVHVGDPQREWASNQSRRVKVTTAPDLQDRLFLNTANE